jgi:hypothetical protein
MAAGFDPGSHPHNPTSHNSETTPATGTTIKIATPQIRAAGESFLEGFMIASVYQARKSARYPRLLQA